MWLHGIWMMCAGRIQMIITVYQMTATNQFSKPIDSMTGTAPHSLGNGRAFRISPQ